MTGRTERQKRHLIFTLCLALSVPSMGAARTVPIPDLPNTAVDAGGELIDPGEKDPHFRLVASPNDEYGPDAYRFQGAPGAWVSNTDSQTSRWIAPAPENPNGWFSPGIYDYEITFDLSGLLYQTAVIEGRWASDGGGQSSGIYINGERVPDSTGGFSEWHPFQVGEGFVAGENTLTFRASNPGTGGSPTGIRVEMEGDAVRGEAFPFFSSLGEDFDEPLNRMWRLFGAVTEQRGGENVVIRFGNEPAFFEWMGRKLMWSDEMDYRAGLLSRVRNFPMSENGYVWSWSNRPDWPTDPGALHQENNAKYILSVYRIVGWTRDLDFLSETDPVTRTPVDGSSYPDEEDVSRGMTILEKIRSAMEYQLEELEGGDGLLVIDNDHNTGLPDGAPTNYWDNFPFGYKDAYSNVYFYASLLAMSDIEAMLGNPDDADYYTELAEKTKRRFTEEFWDLRKGRFVGAIDLNGRVWDLGFTFLNTEALAYGLGDDEQAEAILSWLDGDRIIETDTATGDDIYYFRWAPRSTTVDVAELGQPYWWKDVGGQITVGPGGSATYGEHLENGGAIFYTSHYDLLARARRRGPDDAWERLGVIMEEFAIDELVRNPLNNVGAGWKVGIIGVFPESGLVPASYLYAFLGIEATARGLEIHPNLPGELDHGGIHRLSFGGGFYSVTVEADAVEIEATHEGEHRMEGVLGNLTPGKTYRRIHVTPTTGDSEPELVTASGDGEVEFDIVLAADSTLRIEPAGE